MNRDDPALFTVRVEPSPEARRCGTLGEEVPVSKVIRPSQILEAVDVEAARDAATVLLDGGMPEDEVAREIAALLDAVIPFDLLFPGPVGATAEALDGTVFLAVARLIVRPLVSKERRAARRAKREARKA